MGQPGRLMALLVQSTPEHGMGRDGLAVEYRLRSLNRAVYRRNFVAQDFDARIYTLIANAHLGPDDQFPYFSLRFAAERAAEEVGKIR